MTMKSKSLGEVRVSLQRTPRGTLVIVCPVRAVTSASRKAELSTGRNSRFLSSALSKVDPDNKGPCLSPVRSFKESNAKRQAAQVLNCAITE